MKRNNCTTVCDSEHALSCHARYQYKVVNFAWTTGNGDPMQRCVSHTRYFAHENSKGEERGKIRHKNHNKRVI